MQILSFPFDRNYIHSCEWNAPRTRFWQTCAITGNLINLPDKNRGQVLSQSFYSPKRGSGGIIRGFYGKQTEQISTQAMCFVNRERFQKFFLSSLLFDRRLPWLSIVLWLFAEMAFIIDQISRSLLFLKTTDREESGWSSVNELTKSWKQKESSTLKTC